MVNIIPAILTDSSLKFKELVRKIEPYAHRIHVDVADGDFVPNKTVGGHEEIKNTEAAVKFDVHLMVKKPEGFLNDWFHTHADRFIVHAESEGFSDALKLIKDHKRIAGIAINPETGIDKIEPYLKEVAFVQFMTIHPGFQGQSFLEEIVDKISSFHSKYPDIIIMCDGGVTPETASKLVKAGASELVSGSYIVKSADFEQAINELKKSCTT